jgi:hypothetical protein
LKIEGFNELHSNFEIIGIQLNAFIFSMMLRALQFLAIFHQASQSTQKLANKLIYMLLNAPQMLEFLLA